MSTRTTPRSGTRTVRRPPWVSVLIAGLLFLSVTALYRGVALVVAPDSALLDVDLTHLEGTPFADYVVPGAVLAVVLGLYPLIAIAGLTIRASWAWQASLFAGLLLLGWIAVEAVLVGYVGPSQPGYALFGVTLVVVASLPSVRTYCRG